jgi:hypothetical protein
MPSRMMTTLLAIATLLGGCWESDGLGGAPCVFAAINDIHGSGPADAWAVGEGGCALHWDGADWTAEAAPADALNAVYAVSEDLVFAVGEGHIWRRSADGWSSDFDLPGVDFTDVWAESGDFAVAVGHATGTDSGAIAVRDASSWALVTSLDLPTLNSVWGEGPGAVWAGGFGGTLLQFDGTTWTAEDSACAGGCDITCLHGRGDGELWFVAGGGFEGNLGRRTVDGEGQAAFAYYAWDGDWSQGYYDAVWTASAEGVLAAVSVGSPLDGSAAFGSIEVGSYLDGAFQGFNAAMDAPSDGPTRVTALWAASDAGDIYIAGPTDAGPGLWKLAQTTDGPAWTRIW